MKKIDRTLALILCLMVIAVLLFSSAFVIHGVGHNCIGDGCRVCALIEGCAQNWKHLFCVLIAAAIVIALALALRLYGANFKVSVSHNTLVTLKVRLSN